MTIPAYPEKPEWLTGMEWQAIVEDQLQYMKGLKRSVLDGFDLYADYRISDHSSLADLPEHYRDVLWHHSWELAIIQENVREQVNMRETSAPEVSKQQHLALVPISKLPPAQQGVVDAVLAIWGSFGGIPKMKVVDRNKQIYAWLKNNERSVVDERTIRRTFVTVDGSKPGH